MQLSVPVMARRSAFQRQWQVFLAVILRNMRTRFFGHGLGYLVAVAWPVAHILLLLVIFTFTHRAAPVGESMVLFAATGAVPFQCFSYLARFMMMSMMSIKPLLSFPEVKLMDVILASALQETLACCGVMMVMVLLGWAFGIPIWPHDIGEAAGALGAAILLGIGFGVLNSVISMMFQLWNFVYVLLSIGMWASSGVAFVALAVPEPFRTYLCYNPTFHIVEWMRDAYYEGYGEHLLSREYLLGFGLATLVLGLLLERLTRARILAAR